jgi:hypothetical protein
MFLQVVYNLFTKIDGIYCGKFEKLPFCGMRAKRIFTSSATTYRDNHAG